jgi:hypothetical protein
MTIEIENEITGFKDNPKKHLKEAAEYIGEYLSESEFGKGLFGF